MGSNSLLIGGAAAVGAYVLLKKKKGVVVRPTAPTGSQAMPQYLPTPVPSVTQQASSAVNHLATQAASQGLNALEGWASSKLSSLFSSQPTVYDQAANSAYDYSDQGASYPSYSDSSFSPDYSNTDYGSYDPSAYDYSQDYGASYAIGSNREVNTGVQNTAPKAPRPAESQQASMNRGKVGPCMSCGVTRGQASYIIQRNQGVPLVSF